MADFRVDGNLFVTGSTGIGAAPPQPPQAKIHISDPSFRGSLKLFASSGAGHDFGYDGGTDSLFWFSHYGKESGETKFIWESGNSSRELLAIKNTGRIGMGTANPQTKLHLYSADSPTALRIQSSAGFGAARMEFWSDPQGSTNEWRPAYIQSTDQGGFTGGLAFFVNGTGFASRTGSIEVMRLVSGNVGIGTASPSAKLEVAGQVKATNFTVTSSRQLKDNIAEISSAEAIQTLENLNPVKFSFKSDSDRTQHLGFIAEEVPELVATPDRTAINPMDIIAVLTRALKEQQKTVAALAEKVKMLEAQTA